MRIALAQVNPKVGDCDGNAALVIRAAREVAAYLVSKAAGWDIVPVTVLRSDAPMGEGSLQLFIEHDPEVHYFTLMHDRLDEFARFAAFDVVVNNAGVGTAVPATRETPEQFRKVIDINLNGCYWMAQAFARAIGEDGGSIVNIGSVLGSTTASTPKVPSAARIDLDDDGKVVVKPRHADSKRGKTMWATSRTLVANMVKGVTSGFVSRPSPPRGLSGGCYGPICAAK